ncbi:MAG: hypothetical protein LUH36_10120 [Oscillospiraceae bacterium]|nr:hypothetical protein [Oscillospiraceae bacterium]
MNTKRMLSLLLALAMVLSLGVTGAFASEEPEEDLGGGLGTELIEAGVDVSSDASEEATEEPKDIVVIEESCQLEELTVGENEELRGPNGELVTMTIDGVQTDIVSGESYTGNIVLTLTDEAYLSGPNMGSTYTYEQRAALYYYNGEKVDSLSVDSAVVDNTITSEGTNFNGIMITGDDGSEIDVSGYEINLTGWGENDMGGVGAGLYVVGSDLTANISDVTIRTYGATRTAVFTGGDNVVNLDNVQVYTYSGELPEGTSDLNNMEVPWMLGLIGDCRATNALGGTATTWTNSVVVAYDWGALSTDSIGSSYDAGTNVDGGHVELTTYNTYVATLYSGYGAYADGGALDRFYDSALDVADTAVIMTGTGEATFDGTYVNAGANAVMVHSGGGGTINAIDSEFHVNGVAFLIKDSMMTVNIENSTIAFDGTAEFDADLAASYGVDVDDEIFDYETYDRALYNQTNVTAIVKVQHNADAGSGSDDEQQAVVVNVTGSVLEGDFLNTCADVLSVTTTMMGSEVTKERPSRSLEVYVTDSEITGAVSLGQDTWDSNTLTTISGGENDFQYASSTELGFYTDGEHGLELTLTGSVWNVTETSYLTKLVVDEASVINGTMTVDGVETEIAAGTYEGEIVVSPAEAASGEASAEAAGTAEGLSVEEAYVEYIHEWLLAEDAVNETMTEDIVENEFMPLIEAGDYTTFPAEMLWGGMLETGSPMTYEEFAAQY